MTATDSLLTNKQEAFARLAAEGRLRLSECYRQVYATRNMATRTIHQEACKLAAAPKVTGRIAELRAQAAKAVVVDIACILEELASLRDVAIAKGDLRLAFDCITRRADIAGVLPAEPRIGIRHQHQHHHAALVNVLPAASSDTNAVNAWMIDVLGSDLLDARPPVPPLPNKEG